MYRSTFVTFVKIVQFMLIYTRTCIPMLIGYVNIVLLCLLVIHLLILFNLCLLAL